MTSVSSRFHDIPDGTLSTATEFTVSSAGTEMVMQPIRPPPPPGLSFRAVKTTELGVRAAIVAGDRVKVHALSRARTADATSTARTAPHREARGQAPPHARVVMRRLGGAPRRRRPVIRRRG